MIMTMYAIKDELNGFTTPIPFVNEELAKRYFKDHMIGNPTMQNSKEDFTLWETGTFDTESGTYMNLPNGNKLIEKGVNYGN